jgi:serine/threonine protein kinase
MHATYFKIISSAHDHPVFASFESGVFMVCSQTWDSFSEIVPPVYLGVFYLCFSKDTLKKIGAHSVTRQGTFHDASNDPKSCIIKIVPSSVRECQRFDLSEDFGTQELDIWQDLTGKPGILPLLAHFKSCAYLVSGQELIRHHYVSSLALSALDSDELFTITQPHAEKWITEFFGPLDPTFIKHYSRHLLCFKWYSECLEGIRSCHRSFIVHRDICLQNILLLPSGTAVLCDFGVSKYNSSITPDMGGYSSPSDTESIDSDTYSSQAQQRHDEFTKDLILTAKKEDIHCLKQEFSTLLFSSPKPSFVLPFSTGLDFYSCSSDIDDHIAEVLTLKSDIQQMSVSLHSSKRSRV